VVRSAANGRSPTSDDVFREREREKEKKMMLTMNKLNE
jgi:hypothetical protein